MVPASPDRTSFKRADLTNLATGFTFGVFIAVAQTLQGVSSRSYRSPRRIFVSRKVRTSGVYTGLLTVEPDLVGVGERHE